MLPYATSARVIITNASASVNDYFSENKSFLVIPAKPRKIAGLCRFFVGRYFTVNFAFFEVTLPFVFLTTQR